MRRRQTLTRALCGLLAVAALLSRGSAAAQAPDPAPVRKPLMLPMTDPPGPGVWYLGQAYGNTLGAY
ncbi:MAG TPA: hypothetical protein VJ754_02430, partial [Anaerolineae bacterium]|nr:hypothetical protein [Anaerolineae bacterium]